MSSNYEYENHGRREASVTGDHVSGWSERLGLRAYMERGRPSLDNRWDTVVYEEGLQSEPPNGELGGPRLAVQVLTYALRL